MAEKKKTKPTAEEIAAELDLEVLEALAKTKRAAEEAAAEEEARKASDRAENTAVAKTKAALRKVSRVNGREARVNQLVTDYLVALYEAHQAYVVRAESREEILAEAAVISRVSFDREAGMPEALEYMPHSMDPSHPDFAFDLVRLFKGLRAPRTFVSAEDEALILELEDKVAVLEEQAKFLGMALRLANSEKWDEFRATMGTEHLMAQRAEAREAESGEEDDDWLTQIGSS